MVDSTRDISRVLRLLSPEICNCDMMLYACTVWLYSTMYRTTGFTYHIVQGLSLESAPWSARESQNARVSELSSIDIWHGLSCEYCTVKTGQSDTECIRSPPTSVVRTDGVLYQHAAVQYGTGTELYSSASYMYCSVCVRRTCTVQLYWSGVPCVLVLVLYCAQYRYCTQYWYTCRHVQFLQFFADFL